MIERDLGRALDLAVDSLDDDDANVIAAVLGRAPVPACAPATFRKRVSRTTSVGTCGAACVPIPVSSCCPMKTCSALLLVATMALSCSDKPRRVPFDAAPSSSSSSSSSSASTTDQLEAQLPANARVALTKPAGTTEAARAVVVAQDAVRRELETSDTWLALGEAWMRRARETEDRAVYVNADACASVVLARDPDHPAAADLRARVLSARGEYEEARKLAERITARRPTDVRGWMNLTDALLELGRYEPAGDAAQKLLELGPSAAAHARVARLQWLRGDVVRAKASLESALAENTDAEGTAELFVQSAMIAWHEGDYDTASTAFDRALERLADFPPALEGKGRVAMARSEWARAADLFARAYAARPTLETAWLLGDAREAGGDAKGAEEAHALVAKNAAGDRRAYASFLSAQRGATKEQRSEALRLASEVHVKQFDVYTEDALAWALYRAGMIEPAKTAMGRARKLHTPDARIVFHEGAIRIAAGEVKKGREVVAKALAMNRAFDWRAAKEARELATR